MTPVLALLFLFSASWVSPTAPASAPASIAAPVASPSTSTIVPATPSAAPLITAWMGVTLGETSKDAKTSLGKPREVVPSSMGALWRYDVDNGNATLELVINQDRLLNIAVRVKDGKRSALADPFGASLGMPAQSLQTMRGIPIATYADGAELAYGEPAGVRWFYTLDGGVVTGIEVSQPIVPPSPPQIIADTSHDGSSEGKAFLVKADTQGDSTNAEYAFLHKLACDSGGTWIPVGQELVEAAGRYYDLFHVSCSATKLPRDFYFDVTQGYKK